MVRSAPARFRANSLAIPASAPDNGHTKKFESEREVATMASQIQTATETGQAGRGITSEWIRTGGALGLLSVVLLLGASVASGGVGSLTSSSTPAQISDYLASHQGSILSLTLLTVLAIAIGLWFVATVARVIQVRDPDSPLGAVVLSSGVVATAIGAFDGVTLTALVYLHNQGGPADPALVRIFFDLQNGLIMPGLFGFFMAGTLVALGLAMIRGHLARAWVGWLAVVLAVLSAAGGATGLLSPSGGTSIVGYSPAIGYGIVALITSIYLLRGDPRPHVA